MSADEDLDYDLRAHLVFMQGAIDHINYEYERRGTDFEETEARIAHITCRSDVAQSRRFVEVMQELHRDSKRYATREIRKAAERVSAS